MVVLRERADASPLGRLSAADQITIAIGPEGGWSERESSLIDRLATSASLGQLIMRAEIAAIVAAGVIVQHSYST